MEIKRDIIIKSAENAPKYTPRKISLQQYWKSVFYEIFAGEVATHFFAQEPNRVKLKIGFFGIFGDMK